MLAEDTGGIAVVNQNDFDKALKRIDADSSDYYILGYYSSNPDPTHRRRKIEVKVNRPAGSSRRVTQGIRAAAEMVDTEMPASGADAPTQSPSVEFEVARPQAAPFASGAAPLVPGSAPDRSSCASSVRRLDPLPSSRSRRCPSR